MLLPESNPKDSTNDEISKEDVNGNESLWLDIVPVAAAACCCFIGRKVAVLIRSSSSHSNDAIDEKLLNLINMVNNAMYPTTLAPLSHWGDVGSATRCHRAHPATAATFHNQKSTGESPNFPSGRSKRKALIPWKQKSIWAPVTTTVLSRRMCSRSMVTWYAASSPAHMHTATKFLKYFRAGEDDRIGC